MRLGGSRIAYWESCSRMTPGISTLWGLARRRFFSYQKSLSIAITGKMNSEGEIQA